VDEKGPSGKSKRKNFTNLNNLVNKKGVLSKKKSGTSPRERGHIGKKSKKGRPLSGAGGGNELYNRKACFPKEM